MIMHYTSRLSLSSCTQNRAVCYAVAGFLSVFRSHAVNFFNISREATSYAKISDMDT